MPYTVRNSLGAYAHNNVYLGNKMSGIPQFNAPWFDATTKALHLIPTVSLVFNPAQRDRMRGFEPLNCPNGTMEEARAAGFNANVALREDWCWIADWSDALVVGPDWSDSKGTLSEIACHQALGLPVWELQVFKAYWNKDHLYELVLPPIMELTRTAVKGLD